MNLYIIMAIMVVVNLTSKFIFKGMIFSCVLQMVNDCIHNKDAVVEVIKDSSTASS